MTKKKKKDVYKRQVIRLCRALLHGALLVIATVAVVVVVAVVAVVDVLVGAVGAVVAVVAVGADVYKRQRLGRD